MSNRVKRRLIWLVLGLACVSMLISLCLQSPVAKQASSWFQFQSDDQKRKHVKSQMARLTQILELYPLWQQELLKRPGAYARNLEPMLASISGMAVPEPGQSWREPILQAQDFLGSLRNPYTGQTGLSAVFADWDSYARQVSHPERPASIPPEFQGKVLYRPLKCAPRPQSCQGFQLYTLYRSGKPMPWKESFLP